MGGVRLGWNDRGQIRNMCIDCIMTEMIALVTLNIKIGDVKVVKCMPSISDIRRWKASWTN